MIKKKLKNIYAMVIMFSLLLGGATQIKAEEVHENNQPYKYAVVPGMREWDSLSMDERIKISYVDEDVVEVMTTEALLETTVTYPFIVNICAYDTLREGIDCVREYCPALDIFLEREDSLNVIQNYISECENNNSFEICIVKHLSDYLCGNLGIDTCGLMNPITGGMEAQIKTPNGSTIVVYRELGWSNFGTDYNSVYTESLKFAQTYGATMTRNPSPTYNCHSYAWYSTSASNPYWLQNPAIYISDKSYVASTGNVGDKITYKQNGSYTHSGIMTGKGEVTSKWGCCGVYKHGVTNCPYYVSGVSVNYWKRNN